MTLLDESLVKDIHSDRLGREETYGIDDIIISLKKAFLLSYPMSARRLALAKHKRKQNEPMTNYLVRLSADRVTADSDTSTPGERLLIDLVRGVDNPRLVTQLHKITFPTVESIEGCIIEFVSREQAAKVGTTAEVVRMNQIPTSTDKNLRCYRCASTKHMLKECTTDRSKTKCSFCNSNGFHTTAACTERKANNKNKRSNNTQSSAPSSSSSSTGDMEATYASLDNSSSDNKEPSSTSQSSTHQPQGFEANTDE